MTYRSFRGARPSIPDFKQYIEKQRVPAATDWKTVLGIAAPRVENIHELDTQLDRALYWGSRGLKLFPTERFTGEPLIAKWYSEATDSEDRIIEWFSRWPESDICALPHRSGHFGIAVISEQGGHDSLARLESDHGKLPDDLVTGDMWGNKFIWM